MSGSVLHPNKPFKFPGLVQPEYNPPVVLVENSRQPVLRSCPCKAFCAETHRGPSSLLSCDARGASGLLVRRDNSDRRAFPTSFAPTQRIPSSTPSHLATPLAPSHTTSPLPSVTNTTHTHAQKLTSSSPQCCSAPARAPGPSSHPR